MSWVATTVAESSSKEPSAHFRRIRKSARLYLVGNRADIHAALPKGGFRDHRVRVVHASEVLTMEDKPASAIRRRKIAPSLARSNSSTITRLMRWCSVGNTGGIFAAATFKLGRIAGLDRGGIATVSPAPGQRICPARLRSEYRMQPLHLAHLP